MNRYDATDTHVEGFESWRSSGRNYRHRGHDIFWRDGGTGTGATLVCVHGFPTASWDWHAIWPSLTERFGRVIAADMIGFGWSAKPRGYDYSIFDQADLHENLLRQQGVGSYHILAHDYGDSVAQELLARHDERRGAGDNSLIVESVCLLNGGLFPEMHRPRLVQRLLLTPVGSVVAAMSTERAFARSFAAVFGPETKPSSLEMQQFWKLYSHDGGHRNGHRLARGMAERVENRQRWVGALQRNNVPLRVIDGPLDPISGSHMVERYRELVPDPDVVLLPGIGHYPHVEDPDATLRAFLEFHAWG